MHYKIKQLVPVSACLSLETNLLYLQTVATKQILVMTGLTNTRKTLEEEKFGE